MHRFEDTGQRRRTRVRLSPAYPTAPSRSWLSLLFWRPGSRLRARPIVAALLVLVSEVVSGFGFEDQVEWRLGRSPEARVARFFEHLTKPGLAGLRAEAESDVL